MKLLSMLIFLAVSATLQADPGSERKTLPRSAQAAAIEGYWQDTERRILFSRDAPPAYVYGGWVSLDPEQTYPSAKQIRRSEKGYELTDLLYDANEHTIRIVRADDRGIEFIRTMKVPSCEMRHVCSVRSEDMLCSLENVCREGGKDVLDWRGEERYARRVLCERGPRSEAQGIPHRCR